MTLASTMRPLLLATTTLTAGLEFQHDERRAWSGEFRVEHFVAATMRATIDGPEEPLVAPSSVPLKFKHLAGGGAAYQSITVRTSIKHDDHFDRPGPDARQPLRLTGTARRHTSSGICPASMALRCSVWSSTTSTRTGRARRQRTT